MIGIIKVNENKLRISQIKMINNKLKIYTYEKLMFSYTYMFFEIFILCKLNLLSLFLTFHLKS